MSKDNLKAPAHTPEPWHLLYRSYKDDQGDHREYRILAGSDRSILIARLPGWDEEDEANARRLFAAVRSSEGVPTEKLEGISVSRLLDALERCRKYFADQQDDGEDAMLSMIDAALTKSEGTPRPCDCGEALTKPHEHCSSCDCVLDNHDPHGTRCKSCSPPNTEENRRALAWDFIDSCDSKTLYHMLADMLCSDWEESDENFRDWWRSVHEPDLEVPA